MFCNFLCQLLEYMLKLLEIKKSADKVLTLQSTITTIQIKLPLNQEVYTRRC